MSTLSEEAKDARRNVPQAIMIATIVSGLIFIVLSYVSQLVFPSNEFADVDSGSLDVMVAAGGQFLSTFFTAAYVAGALGSALTSQASVARILFAMGRDGILPRKVFGHVSPRFSTPVCAILVVSVISLLAIVIDLAMLASLISFGALVAFSVVNLSVIKHYFVDLRDALQRGAHISSLRDRLPADGVAVDQPVRHDAGDRIDLARDRVRLAAGGHAGIPAPHSRPRHRGVIPAATRTTPRRGPPDAWSPNSTPTTSPETARRRRRQRPAPRWRPQR